MGFDQLDFDAVIEWTYRKSLRLKCNKTKALLFGAHTRLSNVDRNRVFREMKHEIVYVRNYLYLGIMIDGTMSLVPLIKM